MTVFNLTIETNVDCHFSQLRDSIRVAIATRHGDGTIINNEYQVVAGKIEPTGEYNCKYTDQFATLDQAIEAADNRTTYPWYYIIYKGRFLYHMPRGFDTFS